MFKILYAYKCPKVFPTPQWNLYKADTIGTMNWCPLYGIVRFIEIESLTRNPENLGKMFVRFIKSVRFMVCPS